VIDIVGQFRRTDDHQPEHRLQRRLGERHDRAGTPPFRQQLLDQLEPPHLIVRIDAIAVGIALRRREAVARR